MPIYKFSLWEVVMLWVMGCQRHVRLLHLFRPNQSFYRKRVLPAFIASPTCHYLGLNSSRPWTIFTWAPQRFGSSFHPPRGSTWMKPAWSYLRTLCLIAPTQSGTSASCFRRRCCVCTLCPTRDQYHKTIMQLFSKSTWFLFFPYDP